MESPGLSPVTLCLLNVRQGSQPHLLSTGVSLCLHSGAELFMWIRDPLTFNLAYNFLFLLQNDDMVWERFWTPFGDHFHVETHLHVQLISCDGLTHAQRYKMEETVQAVSVPAQFPPCPAQSLRGSSQNSWEREALMSRSAGNLSVLGCPPPH